MPLDFNTAKFIRSYNSVDQIKNKAIPHFAFIGRSNVGKSSLINALCGIKDLAKTSSVPGKTQLINAFGVGDHLQLIDLPGYGYAKVSKKKREVFEGLISDYLCKSEQLYIVFVLVDASIPPQKIDLEFLHWCGLNEVPVGIVFTKTDKKKANKVKENVADFIREISAFWNELPVIFETSSTKKKGLDELAEWIEDQFE